MKQIINFSLLLAILLFSACRKADNPKIPTLERVPQPQVLKDGGSLAIDVTNLAAFQGTFTVGVYVPTDVAPSKYDVLVRKNGDNGNVKLFKANVTTFPTSLTITGNDLTSLFGAPVVLGDNFDIGVDIYTKSGNKYQAFPAVGNAYGGNVAGQPGASTSISYTAICQYNPDVYQGNFVVVEDDWADFSPGDVVVLTKIDATHFSWIDPFVRDPVPIIVTVNAATNEASISKITIGTSWKYSSNPATYPGPFVLTGAGSSMVSPCDRTVTLGMQYGYSAGQWADTYPLILQKQ